MAYAIGNLVRCTAEFRDPTGLDALVDPSTVTFKLKTPTGTATTSTPTHDSTGRYHADVNVTEAGTWSYRFESTGTYQAAQEGTFYVEQGAF